MIRVFYLSLQSNNPIILCTCRSYKMQPVTCKAVTSQGAAPRGYVQSTLASRPISVYILPNTAAPLPPLAP